MPYIESRCGWRAILSRGLSRVMLLILCLSAFGLDPRAQDSSSASSEAGEEAAIRAVVEKHFSACGKKDMAGVVALWSERSPNLAAYRQSLQQKFTTEDQSFGSPVISRVRVEGGKASLRASITLASIDLKSRQKSERRLVAVFELVKEGGEWKVWRYATAAEDLAEALVKAGSRAERERLLAEEKELVTAELGLALLAQGRRLLNQGSYRQAGEIYELAMDLAGQLDDKNITAGALRGIGSTHRLQGNYAEALEHYQKSLKISEEIGDKKTIAITLNNIGTVHSLQGNYAQGLEQYQKSLKIAEEVGDKADIATALNNIGAVHKLQGDYAQALEQYQKSLKIREEIGDKYGIAETLNNIGVVHRLQGNYAQALEQYQKSLKITEEIGDKAGIAISLLNTGNIHNSQGNYARALEQYQKSLKIAEEIGDKATIAGILNNIGAVHQSQGNYPQALEQFQRSLKIAEEIGDKASIGGALHNIGFVHESQGNYALALEQYQKSLKIAEEIGDEASIAATLNNIGDIHKLQGNSATALEQYQKSLKVAEEIGDRGGIAVTLRNIGEVNYAQGDYNRALQFAGRAAELATQTGDRETFWQARTNAGLSYFALKQFGQARTSFDQAIATVETLRAQVAGSEQEQQRSFESRISPYQAMVELLVAQNDPGQALVYAERARARVLLDLLSNGRIDITKSMTGSEIEQERRLRSQLVSLNSRLFREEQSPQPDRDRLKQLGSQLERARLDFEAFQTTLFAVHPELKIRRGEAPPLRIEQMDALLPDAATALLEFVVAEEKTYLFVLTRPVTAGVKVYSLEIKQKELAERAERFRRRLANRDLDFRGLSRELYGLLLKPAEAQLRGKTRLLIVPDGPLWELPFQALSTPEDRYLIDDHAVFYAPSLTVLREMIKGRVIKTRIREARSSDAPTLLALGNPALGEQTIARVRTGLMDEGLEPLPEAERQVQTLGRIYGPEHSRVYVRAEAREERFKAEAGHYNILHLATHGILNDRSPIYSHLLLSQTGETAEEDGLLEAWELMKMDLKADLAVLSACETGRGRVGKGEGMIGMSWALFVAGVPRTVVSQWKVRSDSTSALMVEFHRQLKGGQQTSTERSSAAEALRAAALRLKEDRQYQHPFYWAGFVMIGDGY